MKRVLFLAAAFAAFAASVQGREVNFENFRSEGSLPDSLIRKIVRESFGTDPAEEAGKDGQDTASPVFWDGATIPDPLFRQYVLASFDTDGDGQISRAEADAVTQIGPTYEFGFTRVNGQSAIKSLKGTDHFRNLKILLIDGDHKFPISDISANTQLEELCTGACDSPTLDLSAFPLLTTLTCGSAKLTRLDLSANKALTSLSVSESALTALILPEAPLIYLTCYNNRALEFLDVSNCPALEILCCDNARLKSLDLSKNTALKKLQCNNNQITSLDLSGNKALIELRCSGNPLVSLDLSANTALTELYISGYKFTTLDLSKNTALKKLHNGGSELTSLDLSANTALEELGCHGEKFTRLTLPKSTSLYSMDCSSTRITSLDLSVCPSLEYVTLGYYKDLKRIDLSNLGKLRVITLPPYNPERDLQVIVNRATRIDGTLKSYLDAQENHKLQAEQARQKVQMQQERAAESKHRVLSCIDRGDWEGADRCAAEALANMPAGDAFLYFVRAKAYYLRNLDFKADPDENVTSYFRAYKQEAQHLVDLCNKSIRLDASARNEARFLRGLAYIVLGMPRESAADFRQYMSGVPAVKAVCYYNIGVAYKNARWWSEALDNFKLARQYYTQKEDIEKCLHKIKACQEKIDGK